MGCLFEFLMEAVFECVAYGYAWLMTLIIPQHKFSKKAFDKIKTVIILLAIVLLGAAIAGLIMWTVSEFSPLCNKIGRIIFFVSAALIAAQIVLGIISKILSKVHRNKTDTEETP